ncbi:MAG: alpha/beta hydrolase [Oceanospirillaceae bacterium]|nr:alpha/beta hydrolase [Oceanospirillaceae bacterium]MBT12591.1 alpha/beta hydrolase [Oceanospirillaceae bacterium]|tara:strand:- start:103473 stop:104234 length:762 start_codon:yes stop_codon:yes gene_type:complete
MAADNKPSIVFIHGMWCGPEVFDHYRAFFENKGYSCHAPALRHHQTVDNRSELPGTTSLLDYASDLETFIRGLPQTPILIGHSMGGLLVQMLCACGLAEKAVLLCPAAPAGIHALTLSVVRSFSGVMTRWGFWKKTNKLSAAAARYAIFNQLPDSDIPQALAAMRYESGRATFETGFWLIDPAKASTVNAALVTQPMLIVSGEDDRITPAKIHRKVAARYGAEFHCYPGHAHWLIAEPGWERIANDIADWLEQ